jgi:hypothetical protein
MNRLALAALAVLLAGGLPLASPAASAAPSRAEEIAAALRTRTIASIVLKDSSVDDLAKFLRIATGFNFHVRRDVIQKAGIDLETVRLEATLEDVTVADLLELLLPPHGLGAVVRGSVVQFTTKADAMGKPVTRLYDVTHLTWKLTDFAAPSLDLHPSGFTAVDEIEPEVVREDPLAEPENILEFVKSLVDVDWTTEGWSISVTARTLVVRAPASVHAKVARALAQVAAFK